MTLATKGDKFGVFVCKVYTVCFVQLKINGLNITMPFYLYSYTNICTKISHYKIHKRD